MKQVQALEKENKEQSKWWIWPLMVVGLMVLQFGLSSTSLYLAISDKSFAVEPSYYSRAINWETSSNSSTSGYGQSWKFQLSIGENDSLEEQTAIRVDLIETSGERIKNATMTLIGFHHSNTKAVQRITMVPTEIGDYLGKLSLEREGIWEIQISARVGENVCEYMQTVNIGKKNFP